VTADEPAAATANGRRSEQARGWLSAFWHRAYAENITGMAAMVAYNLALALFPFALLVLFIFGKLIGSGEIDEAVINDLQGIFPAVETDSVERAVERIRDSSNAIGIAAALGAIWIGASFWGAVDTAFCRIYHVECRGWVAQKRFALVMLVVVTLFLAASAIVPLAERLATSSADDLPFGLDEVQGVRSVAVLLAALTITFAVMSLIYYVVPKGHVPWHGVWPGALFVTVTTAIGNAAFPVYLTSISDLDRIGGALGFILIALIWFYLLALAILAGAVINALRHELHDTGQLDVPGWKPEEPERAQP
jgi:YihY family inner membrane protein